MNTSFIPSLESLKSPPRLSRKDLWLSVLPFVAWIALVQARPLILKTHCGPNLENCPTTQVLPIDQPGLGLENSAADEYSYLTQNFSGILAVSVPAIYQGFLVVLGWSSPALALTYAATDAILFLETWGINGALTEVTRLIVQRPRPFVYRDALRAQDPQNYVSFYSGHTSFAAAAGLCLLLILLSRKAPGWILLFFGATSQCLIISTAVFRILAGRHFLSDVLTSAVIGALVALGVAILHRKQLPITTPRV